jgi:hypothetical protein
VRFQDLTAASMKMRTFWDVSPCCIVGVDRRFRGVYCLHNQSDKSWRHYVSLKRHFTPTRLHACISQKILIIIDVVLFYEEVLSGTIGNATPVDVPSSSHFKCHTEIDLLILDAVSRTEVVDQGFSASLIPAATFTLSYRRAGS